MNRDLRQISQREALLVYWLSIPALRQILNPVRQEPQSSKQKDTHRSQIPSTHILVYDRLVDLTTLEDMLQKVVPLRSWKFGHRTFEEHLTHIEFKNWLAQQMSWEPETISHIDQTKKIAYLGIGIKTPPGRVLRKFWQETDQQRRAVPSYGRFKVLPSQERQLLKQRQYFNLAEQQMGIMTEQRTLLLPADGSLIDVRCISVAHQTIARVTIQKRDTVFGIKQPLQLDEAVIKDLIYRETAIKNATSHPGESSRILHEDGQQDVSNPEDGEHELNTAMSSENNLELLRFLDSVKNHQSKCCELFVNFGHGLRIVAESNFTRIDPEDHAIEQHLTGNTKQLDTARFLASLTITKKRGNIIKLDGNGNILQMYKPAHDAKSSKLLEAIGISQNHSGEPIEASRMVSGKGIVTVYIQDGTHRLLFPSGRIDISTKGEHYFTITPAGTKYLVEKSGEKKVVETIAHESALDPETGIRFTSRKDHLSIFKYADGSRLVIFPDGTRVSSDPTKSSFRIEHDQHDPIKIDYDYFRARNPSMIGSSSAFATQGKDNLFERSYTGRVVSVLIKADNNVCMQLQSYKEMRELPGYNNYMMVNVGVLSSPCGKILKLENCGEVVYLDRRDFRPLTSGNVKEATGTYREGNQQLTRTLERSISVLSNRASELQRLSGVRAEIKAVEEARKVSPLGSAVGTLGMESQNNSGLFDYFIQLFLPRKERTGGIYTIDINEGKLYARDQESNEFTIDRDGRVRSNINVSFNLNSEKPEWDEFPQFSGEEYVDPENYDLPVPKDWRPHELVVVKEGGDATVLYTPNQLQDYFENKTFESSLLLQRPSSAGKQGISVITMRDCDEESLQSINRENSAVSPVRLPYSGQGAPPAQQLKKWQLPSRFRGLPKTRDIPSEAVPRTILERTFSVWPAVQPGDAQVLSDVENQSKDHAKKREELIKSLNIYGRSQEECASELELQNKMMLLGLEQKNIISYGQSNKTEISNPHNVHFAEV